MDAKTLHDLAVAYAHAKLIQSQQAHPENSFCSMELQGFLKSYHYALLHLPEEDVGIDLSTLM